MAIRIRIAGTAGVSVGAPRSLGSLHNACSPELILAVGCPKMVVVLLLRLRHEMAHVTGCGHVKDTSTGAVFSTPTSRGGHCRTWAGLEVFDSANIDRVGPLGDGSC